MPRLTYSGKVDLCFCNATRLFGLASFRKKWSQHYLARLAAVAFGKVVAVAFSALKVEMTTSVSLAGIMRQPGAAGVVVVLVWACVSFINLTTPSFIWEEGTNAVIARQILTGRDWLPPVIYGLREVDKPYLLAWVIAGFSMVTGEVNELSARLPVMVAVLVTTLLVQSMTRRYASLNASLFASLAFLLSPMLLQKLTIAEPDTFVTLLSFAALTLWWNGAESNEITIWRWIGCGGLLAALTLFKGPQPVAFFALGVTAYEVLNRRWIDLPGLFVGLSLPGITALVWGVAVYQPGDEQVWFAVHRVWAPNSLSDYIASNSRTLFTLLVELIPAIFLAPFAPWPWRGAGSAPPPIVAPLILYSVLCTIVVVLWPGGAAGRYAMPITPAVAVLGGIGWDRLNETKYFRLRWLAGGALILLCTYQIAWVAVVKTFYSDRFGTSRLDGSAIESAIRAAPAPIYCADPATNQLFYVRMPVKYLTLKAWQSLEPPAWLVTPENLLPQLAGLRPDLEIRIVVTTTSGPHLVAAHIEKR